MRHFYLDFIFTAIALAIAAWWGYSHGGMGGLIATLFIYYRYFGRHGNLIIIR